MSFGTESLPVMFIVLLTLTQSFLPIREDVESALNEFDRWAKQRRATPWNSDLAVRLIQKDDTKSLDRLFRINSQVHGEMNSLYDLSLAFLRCDRVNQARKLLQVPTMQVLWWPGKLY